MEILHQMRRISRRAGHEEAVARLALRHDLVPAEEDLKQNDKRKATATSLSLGPIE